jgi:hypothetical protein
MRAPFQVKHRRHQIGPHRAQQLKHTLEGRFPSRPNRQPTFTRSSSRCSTTCGTRMLTFPIVVSYMGLASKSPWVSTRVVIPKRLARALEWRNSSRSVTNCEGACGDTACSGVSENPNSYGIGLPPKNPQVLGKTLSRTVSGAPLSSHGVAAAPHTTRLSPGPRSKWRWLRMSPNRSST